MVFFFLNLFNNNLIATFDCSQTLWRLCVLRDVLTCLVLHLKVGGPEKWINLPRGTQAASGREGQTQTLNSVIDSISCLWKVPWSVSYDEKFYGGEAFLRDVKKVISLTLGRKLLWTYLHGSLSVRSEKSSGKTDVEVIAFTLICPAWEQKCVSVSWVCILFKDVGIGGVGIGCLSASGVDLDSKTPGL